MDSTLKTNCATTLTIASTLPTGSFDARRVRPTAMAPNLLAQGTALSAAGYTAHGFGSAIDLPGSVPRSAPV